MRCPRNRKRRSPTFARKGDERTFVCVGKVMKAVCPGDVVCCCMRSMNGVVIDVEVRPDEAMEISAGLALSVKRFLLTSKAYKRVYDNEESTMG